MRCGAYLYRWGAAAPPSPRAESAYGGQRQYALAQQVNAGPPVSLPFDQLEPIDLALGLPGAPLVRERCVHGRPVLPDPGSNTRHLRDAAAVRRVQPGRQARLVALPHEPAEFLSQRADRLQLRAAVA